ncbi:MAG: winged helix-turn-helix transcriptional regulator [Deltaproteobacteria bacterium]|nr:winged helix-turn-helix transcriptional regulator [Deltaproteobacteria bacterium]
MTADKVFKALSDKNRRKIISLLRQREMTAGEIAKHFNISKPSISEHLKILRNADVVYSEKQGQFVTYYLNTTVFQDLISFLIGLSDDKETGEK